MTMHSKEPWRSRPLMQGGVQVIENGEPYAIAIVSAPSLDTGKGVFVPIEGVDHVANARRVVACVNACTGVDTGALEKMPGSFGDLLSLEFTDVVSQRDTLLAALRAIKQEIFYGIKEGAADRIDAIATPAIAAVKRGAV